MTERQKSITLLSVGTVVVAWIGLSLLYPNDNGLTFSQKKELQELEEAAESGEPVDTENTALPEIIVNEDQDIPEPDEKDKDIDEVKEKHEDVIGQIQETGGNPDEIAKIELPEKINLAIPFFAQAPDGDWSLPWKEACEEASLVLAAHFLMDEGLSKSKFKEKVLAMTKIEEERFGTYIDTNMEQTAQLFEEFYGIGSTKIIDNPTIEQIKAELAQGNPIIAPFAGRELGNSNFTNGGPRYHVLVVRGYDDTYFYTNDVGTKRGENFPYTYDVFMNALHDLVIDGQGDIRDGAKRILVLSI